ncbi:MAG: sensor histidine kinase [Vulcanimicrobiota bacterium]
MSESLLRSLERERRARQQAESIAESRTRELYGLNCRLEQLVDEKTIHLRHALEVARSADQTRSAFIARISHELRTPLTAILGFTELMLAGVVEPLGPRQRTYLEQMQAQGKRLQNLLENLLDFAEEQELAPTYAPFLPSRLLVGAREVFANLAAQRGLAFELVQQGEDGPFHGSAETLELVLHGLLSNALRLTPVGGKIKVQVTSSSDRLRVSVTDTGPGLSREAMGRLFESFHPLDSSLCAESQGAGLGLALARQRVEAHGGQVWACSDGPGSGATFAFEVPSAASGHFAPP